MTSSRSHAFIYDMDGLLIDSESLYQRSRNLAAGEFGFSIDRNFYFQYLAGRHLDDCEDMLRQRAGGDLDYPKFAQRCMYYVRELTSQRGLELKPGVVEFLEFTSSLGLSAVASGSNSNHVLASLDATGIRKYFDVIVGRDHVNEGKPSPELFEKAACQLGIEPKACLVFEDSNSGVLAAKRAKMDVVMIPDIQSPDETSNEFALAILRSIDLAKPVVEAFLQS